MIRPLVARAGRSLSGGLDWHFFLMWPLIGVGLMYVGYLLFSGEGMAVSIAGTLEPAPHRC